MEEKYAGVPKSGLDMLITVLWEELDELDKAEEERLRTIDFSRNYEGKSSQRSRDDDCSCSSFGTKPIKNVPKRRKEELEVCGLIKNKKRKVEKKVDVRPAPAPLVMPELDIPAGLEDHIRRNKKGDDIKLVIQKALCVSDLKENQNRFSIPMNQIRNLFLTQEEEEFLKKRDENGNKVGMKVVLIEPKMEEETVLTLKRWDMEKKNGGNPSSSYVLITKWMHVVRYNRLTTMDTVQLWSFRVDCKLHLALVLLKKN